MEEKPKKAVLFYRNEIAEAKTNARLVKPAKPVNTAKATTDAIVDVQ
jgi:hypothetical protein